MNVCLQCTRAGRAAAVSAGSPGRLTSPHLAPTRSPLSPAGQLPDYLTSEAFYKFSPSEELTTLPGDVARTEFRLAATLAGGWEYTLCERTLPGPADPDRRLLVTVRAVAACVLACLLARGPALLRCCAAVAACIRWLPLCSHTILPPPALPPSLPSPAARRV